MSPNTVPHSRSRPSASLSVVIFLCAVTLMAYLRLFIFSEEFISLTYGLPLLICLWHRDWRLLWAMAAAFVGMATFKTLAMMPNVQDVEFWTHWLMHNINIVVIAAVVHKVMNLTGRIEAKNIELEQANDELAAHEEEISRQNEQLQIQSEEMVQQNEELQQQTEELQCQSEDLQTANTELRQRESMLQTILQSLRLVDDDRVVLEGICRSVLELLGGAATAATVVEREGDELVLHAHAGPVTPTIVRVPYQGSFAEVVMEKNRTAYVDDLQARPDLVVQQFEKRTFRSVLAAPIRVAGMPAGAVKLYADAPCQWTTEQFRVVEWVAAQCSLILELRRLQEELTRTNANLERVVEERTTKLREMVEELEHFSYSITHDMRAPLRAMQGFAEMLSRECGETPGERQDYLARIMTAAARMDRLITDALSYSKAVRQEMTLGPVDATRLLKGMIDSYPEFQQPRARIEIADSVPLVLANEAGLTQCFSNLLDNAVKFVERDQHPNVRIRAERHNGFVRLWFEDNGIGIPREMTPKMFGMFQRGSRAYEGTGIGLALVRKVTERMGGKVGVESEPGQGSRFWVELKAAEPIPEN